MPPKKAVMVMSLWHTTAYLECAMKTKEQI